MMNEAVTYIRGRMLELSDYAYGDFVKKTTPAVARRAIIGVRIPRLRALAKELANSDEAEAFMRILPHEYYEENNLHAFLIEKIKDFEECLQLRIGEVNCKGSNKYIFRRKFIKNNI